MKNAPDGAAFCRRFEIGDVGLDRLVAFIADRPGASIDAAPAPSRPPNGSAMRSDQA